MLVAARGPKLKASVSEVGLDVARTKLLDYRSPEWACANLALLGAAEGDATSRGVGFGGQGDGFGGQDELPRSASRKGTVSADRSASLLPESAFDEELTEDDDDEDDAAGRAAAPQKSAWRRTPPSAAKADGREGFAKKWGKKVGFGASAEAADDSGNRVLIDLRAMHAFASPAFSTEA